MFSGQCFFSVRKTHFPICEARILSKSHKRVQNSYCKIHTQIETWWHDGAGKIVPARLNDSIGKIFLRRWDAIWKANHMKLPYFERTERRNILIERNAISVHKNPRKRNDTCEGSLRRKLANYLQTNSLRLCEKVCAAHTFSLVFLV